jgi:hypothetical protein
MAAPVADSDVDGVAVEIDRVAATSLTSMLAWIRWNAGNRGISQRMKKVV